MAREERQNGIATFGRDMYAGTCLENCKRCEQHQMPTAIAMHVRESESWREGGKGEREKQERGKRDK